jgi:hypothetical protein
MTARACLLDYDTAAGSDKFGNFFVLRLVHDFITLSLLDVTACIGDQSRRCSSC